jgi:hypothetical protein
VRSERTRDVDPFTEARIVVGGTTFVALVACLGVVAAFFLIRPALAGGYFRPRSDTGYSYWFLVLLCFVPYGLALRAYGRGERPSLRFLFWSAVALYVVLIPAPAQQSQDLYQSLLYGKMALHGNDPYVLTAARIGDPWRAWTKWNDTLSVYGPVWTALCAAVVWAARGNLTASFLLLKAVAAGCAIGCVSMLMHVANAARRQDAPGLRHDAGFVVLAFALNPLVVFSVGLGAHPDVVVAALVAGAVLAERRGRDVLTTLALVLATLVKAYAGLVLVAWLIALVRRRGTRTGLAHASLCAAAAVAAYAPFWRGMRTFAGLRDVGRLASASLTGSIVRMLSDRPTAVAAAPTTYDAAVRWIALVVIAIATWGVARSSRTAVEPWRAAALLFGAYAIVTPWYLPWQLLGLLALGVVVADETVTRPVLVFSGTSLFVGGGLLMQSVVRYGPPLVVAAREAVADPRPTGGVTRSLGSTPRSPAPA